jgi:hypothetical protein
MQPNLMKDQPHVEHGSEAQADRQEVREEGAVQGAVIVIGGGRGQCGG